MKMKFTVSTFACLAMMIAVRADAALITFTDRPSFDAAAGATTTEDFESFLADAPFHTVSVDVGDFTLSMTGSPSTSYNKIDLALPDSSETDVNGTTNMRVFTNVDPGADLIFTFDAPITAFGADFRSFNDSIARTRLLIGADIATPPVGAGSGLFSFFGFVSTTPFTTITFDGLANDVYGIDNVSYNGAVAAVPEPTALALASWGVGMVSMALVARRRRRQKQTA